MKLTTNHEKGANGQRITMVILDEVHDWMEAPSNTASAMTAEERWEFIRTNSLGPDTPPGDEDDLDEDALEDVGFPI